MSVYSAAGDGYGASMMDLLNLPINERALESLLAGEWQVGSLIYSHQSHTPD